MKKVPNMISTKDLAYIEDMFNWNMILVHKLDLYLDSVTDDQIVEKLSSLRDMHLGNCCELINILEGKSK